MNKKYVMSFVVIFILITVFYLTDIKTSLFALLGFGGAATVGIKNKASALKKQAEDKQKEIDTIDSKLNTLEVSDKSQQEEKDYWDSQE